MQAPRSTDQKMLVIGGSYVAHCHGLHVIAQTIGGDDPLDGGIAVIPHQWEPPVAANGSNLLRDVNDVD